MSEDGTVAGGGREQQGSDAHGGGFTGAVNDPDDSAARAERLGATIVMSSDDLWTKNALVRDPQGAEFTISQFTPPDGDW